MLALKRGEAHCAGTHLLDEATGEYNVSYIKKLLPDTRVVLVNLVHRTQGFIVPKGNPKNIRGFEDLVRDDVTFVNRQAGAGTRLLTDLYLKRLAIDPSKVKGYHHEEYTHMAVAAAVLSGAADTGLAVLSAAQALDLDFVPVASERYDLAILGEYYNDPMLQALLGIIREDTAFRDQIRSMGGYDVMVAPKPGQFTAGELAAGQGPATNLSAGAGKPPVPLGTTSVSSWVQNCYSQQILPDGSTVQFFQEPWAAKHYLQGVSGPTPQSSMFTAPPGPFALENFMPGHFFDGWITPSGTLKPPQPHTGDLKLGWKMADTTAGGSALKGTNDTGAKVVQTEPGKYKLEFADGTDIGTFHSPLHAMQFHSALEEKDMVPGDMWTSVPGQKGDIMHPNGLSVEKAATGNWHIKDSNGHMIDSFHTKAEAKAAANAKHITPATSAPMGPASIDGWKQVGQQLGSNKGGTYIAPNGQKYYVKYPNDEDMTRNEMLGFMLYKAMGIHTPEVELVTRNGKLGIASKWVEGIQTSGHEDELAAAAGAKEGFAADAWLANWDVVGMQRDNMLLDAGQALRADAGGSLLYRGLQGPKGGSFTDTVKELDSMRNGRNRYTSPVFQSMTDAEVAASAQKVADLHPDEIRMLVEKHGPGSDVVKSNLADRLIARREDILRRTGLADPHRDVAFEELSQNYGITKEELNMMKGYEPNVTTADWLERYKVAEENAIKDLGLTSEQYRDPAYRAKAMGALEENLARGSGRLNPAPRAPMNMKETNWVKYNNSTGWPHPYLFLSKYDPITKAGGTYFTGYDKVMENVRAIVDKSKLFNPDEILHNPYGALASEFEAAYNYLQQEEKNGRIFRREYYPDPKAGTGTIFDHTAKEVLDRWRNYGTGAGYSHAESQKVALTLQQMGFRGISTYERGGNNYALMFDVPLRWHKAPFDPRKEVGSGVLPRASRRRGRTAPSWRGNFSCNTQVEERNSEAAGRRSATNLCLEQPAVGWRRTRCPATKRWPLKSSGRPSRDRRQRSSRVRSLRCSMAAPAEGGKTEGSIGDWLEHSGTYGELATGVFFRRKFKQLEEVIARTKQLFPHIGAKFNEQRAEWVMPGGGRLKFRYIERDSDAEEYQGHSYSRVYVEEVTNFPTSASH